MEKVFVGLNMIKINRVIVAGFAVVALSAQATDLKNRYKDLSSSYKEFSGVYAGLNGGYSWGRSSVSTQTVFVPSSYFLNSDIDQINKSGSRKLQLNNFIGGVQAGFNYQMGNLVLGTEVDFNLYPASSSQNINVPYESSPPFTFTLQTKTKSNWFFTARPRIGWLVNKALIYTTGGLALSNLTNENIFSDNTVNDPPTNAFERATVSRTKSGFILGCGIEVSMLYNFSIKVEYLYANYGHISSSGNLNLNPAYLAGAPSPIAPSAPFNYTANLTSNIARLGLNYKFKDY